MQCHQTVKFKVLVRMLLVNLSFHILFIQQVHTVKISFNQVMRNLKHLWKPESHYDEINCFQSTELGLNFIMFHPPFNRE